MQIQDSFGGFSLSALAALGLGSYGLIPDFKARCPLCRGTGCAVRHGLYYRRVVDADGSVIPRFPIPRFRCRCRGSHRIGARTFSVLPVALAPRRRFSLPLMLLIVDLLRPGRSISAVLDRLALLGPGAGEALLIGEIAIYRVLSFLARAHQRLVRIGCAPPVAGSEPGSLRAGALAFADLFSWRGPAAPDALAPVLRFHRANFPHLLLDVPRER